MNTIYKIDRMRWYNDFITYARDLDVGSVAKLTINTA